MASLSDLSDVINTLASLAQTSSPWNPLEEIRSWFDSTGVDFSTLSTPALGFIDWIDQQSTQSGIFYTAQQAQPVMDVLNAFAQDNGGTPVGRAAGNLYQIYSDCLVGSIDTVTCRERVSKELGIAQTDVQTETDTTQKQATNTVEAPLKALGGGVLDFLKKPAWILVAIIAAGVGIYAFTKGRA